MKVHCGVDAIDWLAALLARTAATDPVLNLVDLLEHIRDLGNLAVLALHRLKQFLDTRRKQFFHFLLQKWPDRMKKFLSLSLLLLSLAKSAALKELHQVCELELFLAGVFEDLAPLFVRLQEELLAVELISLKKGAKLGRVAQACVVQHWHALLVDVLDQALDALVKLCVVSPNPIQRLKSDHEHVSL